MMVPSIKLLELTKAGSPFSPGTVDFMLFPSFWLKEILCDHDLPNGRNTEIESMKLLEFLTSKCWSEVCVLVGNEFLYLLSESLVDDMIAFLATQGMDDTRGTFFHHTSFESFGLSDGEMQLFGGIGAIDCFGDEIVNDRESFCFFGGHGDDVLFHAI